MSIQISAKVKYYRITTATITSKWNENLQKWNTWAVGKIISEIYDLSLSYASFW